jgi:uncharacterized membrane protein YdfJ with MMPL/SSD domain
MSAPSRDAAGPRRAPLLGRIARVAMRRRTLILLATLAAFALALPAALTVVDATRPYEFRDPDAESTRASERYMELTGSSATPDIAVLVLTPSAAQTARTTLAGTDGVGTVARRRIPAGSGEPQATLLVASTAAADEDQADVGERVLAAFAGDEDVVAGGRAVASYELNEQSTEDVREVELIALPLVFLLCLLAFRGLVAALLPVALGALSVVFSLAALNLIAGQVAIDLFSVNVVVALGLGLALDYSLFVVSRHREELSRGLPADRALESAMLAAGRTVAFSAAVLTLALLTMLVFPQRFLYSVAIAGALVAAISAAITLVVLPALLDLAGKRIRSREPRPGEAAASRWAAVAHWTMGRPLVVGAVASICLLLAAAPLSGLELTAADARALPPERSSRQLEERLAALPGQSGEPISLLVAGSTSPANASARTLAALPAVERVRVRSLSPTDQRIDVFHHLAPHSPAAQELLTQIRAAVPSAAALGATAEIVDAKSSLRSHAPPAFALLVASSLILLAALTRSLVLPLIMVAFNLLSIAAAFGIVILVFQEGALAGLVEPAGAIDISIPVLLFAVAFGLSTDYGIFVLARIKEARDAGASEEAAIAAGLARSGALVTIAACLFAVAVGGFVTSELVLMQQLSVGLVAAVLIDATIVRAFLVPAALRLLGPRAWWAPRRLAVLPSRP